MRIAVLFGLLLTVLAACDAGTPTGTGAQGGMSGAESIEQAAEDADLPE